MTTLRTGTLVTIALFLAPLAAQAAKLVEVLPLTDKILMVHFDDGSVAFAAPGADVRSEVVTIAALDRTAASNAASYKITSADDPAYSTPKTPSSAGRKSKPTEVANHCDSWSGTACVNSAPDRTLEHWIYLNLPTALQPGKTYTIDTGTLATNTSTTQLTFDVTKVRSEAIHVNTVAYSTKATMKHPDRQ